MISLTLKQLLELLILVVISTGGTAGLRDLGSLAAAVASKSKNVFGDELYPSILDKATAMIRVIVANHSFVYGNKRTAKITRLTMLDLNGTKFSTKDG